VIVRALLLTSAIVVGAIPLHATGRPVVLTSEDGTPLAASLYDAPVRSPVPGVVLVHMLGRSKSEWAQLSDRLQESGITVLAIDLRGHGDSSGSPALLPPMVADVRAAIKFLASRPTIRPDALAVIGASLGANLAALAAADNPAVRAVGLLSPSLDYRGLRIDPALIKKLADRPLWLASSTQDPYALRTLKELAAGSAPREQRLVAAAAHGTQLLAADPDVTRSLVDWLRRTLIF
jgi:alpha-beta hydrolase superfamily lysophospholipase